ncbi:DUF2326 domain-containing protein [Aneurinibacillus aneurinilyticus]|uniref:DUF2326 domain-containing protein n=1 Tax=Aneurinibacillus aneurinilyticus ATCC 12856 TaxID=649747 RepID=U1YGT3_ANEAE|nr:DUF2326 domain-containing protein [Aneurinibacillus aneurinilyticus]ERI11277.1 hypothetical protein HMPREF0083_00688 [Aneurinibacillus aneurinilyticus ATCC 12856]MED0705013.1 DUF2326 domain-containing protein [Aneurinibacillus aneurinilyticus]MED0721814.1 DUF2326 domain-containing protein [Aneurinibacillus aneurinilyticus]MED0734866.1 DUF2326 domain-containing protein [Aneurinibacillus aneurinilyticus]MED0741707.1 DUF2326 domain-containing protein [Aneurinibacillus aneurinilyticus]
MLKEIQCDKFAPDHRVIRFNSGLNTVLGSAGGSNAIGKSTFLWIIDYVFGGESYYSLTDDIKKEMGSHIIYFTFEFDEQPYYFYRSTDDPKNVYRSDEEGRFITKLSLEDFRKFLFQEYKIELPALTFSEITERFFRIYGRENTLEKYPLLVKPREQDEKAVDFLLKLFGHYRILASIKSMEEELGIKSSQLKSRQRQKVDIEKIESNQKTIESLRNRLQKLMKNSEEAQLALFGFDTQTFERISAIQKELNIFVRKRNRLQSQLNAIKNNIAENKVDTASEFDSLVHFFPNTNLKAFEEIEYFHKKIREILSEEMDEEIERLQPLIGEYDKEITRLNRKIEESGLAKEMSERVLSQCVNVSKSIDKLEEETAELIHQKELQETRAESEQILEQLLLQQTEKLEEIQDDINLRMEIINGVVTERQETAPLLYITPQKGIIFETPSNTSEGTAYKSLVVYDLSILELRPIPALIHDSNILKRIEDVHLERILERYQASRRQVFIAFDKADSTTTKAHKILESTAILRLSDGNELFGRSWSKYESNDY